MKYVTMNPPNAGPNIEPKATKEPEIPKAFPLSLGGKHLL